MGSSSASLLFMWMRGTGGLQISVFCLQMARTDKSSRSAFPSVSKEQGKGLMTI